jgi:hypothetical protein
MKQKLSIAGIVIGAILALGPLWGMVGAAFGMQRALDVLGESGIADPRALSSAIGVTLFLQIFGLVAWPFGIVLCIVSIIMLLALQRRPPPLPPPAQGTLASKE